MRQALEAGKPRLASMPSPSGCLRRPWRSGRRGPRSGSKTFQRASSAVEGRNGTLAQLHHNQRGLPKQRYKVWTVLHNFDCRAADGTTPAARFFRRPFPDLFDTVLSHIEALPRPRQRNRDMALRIDVMECPALSGYPNPDQSIALMESMGKMRPISHF